MMNCSPGVLGWDAVVCVSVMIAKSAVELRRCWNMRWGLSGKSLVLCIPLALAKVNDVMFLSTSFCPSP